MKNLVLIVCLMVFSVVAQANLIIVNSNQDAAIDDGLCTLREALAAANYDVAYFGCSKGLGDDIIWVLLGSNGDAIQVNNTLPIFEGVEIQGPGADNLVLFPADGNDDSIFLIDTTDDVKIQDIRIGGARSSAIDVVNVDKLTIEDMNFISNSAGGAGTYGGAIHADLEVGDTESINELIVTNAKFTNNSASSGGALAVSGRYPVNISNSVFSQNNSPNVGGAILKRGVSRPVFLTPLFISNSQFIDNTSNTLGSAIFIDLANVNISQSLFHDHQGQSVIYLQRGISYIQNSLFAENTVNEVIVNRTPSNSITSSELTLGFNTFLDNQDKDVVNSSGDPSLVITYLMANVFDGADGMHCSGPNMISLGNNVQKLSDGCAAGIDDYPSTDPLLLPLAVYDGDVLIAPPSPISPLVDAGESDCNSFDLSGEGRSRDGDADGMADCDIGAVERPDAYNLNVDNIGSGDGHVYMLVFDMSCYSPDDCDWPLEQGLTFMLEPVADSGSEFIGWGGACSGNGNCLVTMNSAKNVTAEFSLAANPAQLSVVKNLANPSLEVTVTSSPAGISCGNNCSAGFSEGDLVTLIADVEPGTMVDSWENCDIVLQNGRLCRVGLTGDTTVTVNAVADADVIFANGFESL